MSNFGRHVGKIINRAKAKKLKENWKKTKILTESSFVGADILLKLLERPGAVGVRICYGMDDAGNMQPLLYACDANGKIVISSVAGISLHLDVETNDDSDDGSDASLPCPPYCP
jgi:hypothetical protein